MSAATIPFTASIKADPTEVYYENNVITDGSAANEIVVAEDNSFVSLNFWGSGKFMISWDNADAIVELLAWGEPATVLENGGVITAAMWGTNLKVYFANYATGTVNLTITPYVAPGQELVVGDNTITVDDAFNGTNVTLTATEAVTYYIVPGTNAVVGYNYENFFAGDVIVITLAAGDSASLVVLTEDYMAGQVVVTVSTTEPSVGGGDKEEGNGLAGSGTERDPWVIETLPLTVDLPDGHDKYFTFTAPANGILTVVCPAGCLVTNNMSVSKDANGNYVFVVTEGTVVSLNPWDNVSTAETCTYEFTFEESAAGDEGEEDSNVITYISAKHSSGRSIKVEINLVTGAVTLTRSNMSGGWDASIATATCVVEAGATVTAENVSNGNAVTVVFDETGVPTSITWGTATYENFVLEA